VKLVNAELLREKIIGPLPSAISIRDDQAGAVLRHRDDTRAEIERMTVALRTILSKPV